MSLRVAFVMPGVGRVHRGAEAFILDLLQALGKSTEFDVTLFSCGPMPDPAFSRRPIRALDRDLPWLQSLYNSTRWARKGLDTLFLDPLNLEWATASLSAFPALRRERFQAIIMEGGLMGGWLCRILRRFQGTAFVDVAHGLSPKWEGAFARQKPDRVVTFTRAGAEMIRHEAPGARIEVIPHGVDLLLFRPDEEPVELPLDRPVFVTAGAVEEHKRMETAVRALAEAGRGSLLVLGDGPRAGELDELGNRLLGSRRYLRTWVPRESMAAWYSSADCFTLPSVSEAFGLVYLEAMACGLPCVAPDDPVRREVIAEAGRFCDVTDSKTYGEVLLAAAAHSWDHEPRRRAEAFPFSATAKAYAELLQEVVRCRSS